MKSRILTALALLLGSATLAYGHDLFVKMDNTTVAIAIGHKDIARFSNRHIGRTIEMRLIRSTFAARSQ